MVIETCEGELFQKQIHQNCCFSKLLIRLWKFIQCDRRKYLFYWESVVFFYGHTVFISMLTPRQRKFQRKSSYHSLANPDFWVMEISEYWCGVGECHRVLSSTLLCLGMFVLSSFQTLHRRCRRDGSLPGCSSVELGCGNVWIWYEGKAGDLWLVGNLYKANYNKPEIRQKLLEKTRFSKIKSKNVWILSLLLVEPKQQTILHFLVLFVKTFKLCQIED